MPPHHPSGHSRTRDVPGVQHLHCTLAPLMKAGENNVYIVAMGKFLSVKLLGQADNAIQCLPSHQPNYEVAAPRNKLGS